MASVSKSVQKLMEELHQAAKLGNLEKMQKVFEQQAGKKVKLDLLLPELSETVLTEAIKGGDLRIIEILIEHGAGLNAHNFSGKGPMHMGAHLGNTRVLASLLQHGASPDAPDNTGRSALHWSARQHDSTTELLLKHGASVNNKAKDGATPLHDAAQYGTLEIVNRLLDNGADIKALTEKQECVAFYAAKGGKLDILKFLIEKGVDPKALTSDGETLCHAAAANGQLPIIQELVDNHGINTAFLNTQTTDGVSKIAGKPLPSAGWTALHFACAGGHAPVVKYLIEKGVNWSLRSSEEMAPKDLVKIYKHIDKLMPLFPTKKQEAKNWKNY